MVYCTKYYSYLLLLYSLQVFAQDSSLVFDRPGIADSPYIVQHGETQIEGGYSFTNGFTGNDFFKPGIMLRKGLWKSAECRVASFTLPQSYRYLKIIDSYRGNDFSLGVKQKILREHKHIPETAMMFNTYYNFKFTSPTMLNELSWELQLLFHHNFSDKIGLNYNLGILRAVKNTSTFLSQHTCLSISIWKGIGFFAENFNYYDAKSKFLEISYDVGLVYAIKKYQFDLSYVANHNENNLHYGSILVGFSAKL